MYRSQSFWAATESPVFRDSIHPVTELLFGAGMPSTPGAKQEFVEIQRREGYHICEPQSSEIG
jgi:hypothetical protein